MSQAADSTLSDPHHYQPQNLFSPDTNSQNSLDKLLGELKNPKQYTITLWSEFSECSFEDMYEFFLRISERFINESQDDKTLNVAKEIKSFSPLRSQNSIKGIKVGFLSKTKCTAFGVLMVENESTLSSDQNIFMNSNHQFKAAQCNPQRRNDKRHWSQYVWLKNKTSKFKQTHFIKNPKKKTKIAAEISIDSIKFDKNNISYNIMDEVKTVSSMNLLQMNMQGYDRNTEFINKILSDNEVNIAAFVETHKMSDLDIQPNEVNSYAIREQLEGNNTGRNSGGVQIGSTATLINSINKQGFAKTTINEIIIVCAQFNQTGIRLNKDYFQEQLKDVATKRLRVVVVGDFNELQDSNNRTLNILGFKRIKTGQTWRNNNNTSTNDQIWSLNVNVSLIKQIKPLESGNIMHRSDHDAIVIKIDKDIPETRSKKLIVPKDQDKLNQLMDTFNFNLSNCEAKDNLDKFYKSIQAAAEQQGCLLNFKPGAKVKKYLNRNQKDTYTKLLLRQNDAKGDPELYKKSKKIADNQYKHMKQKKWIQTSTEAVENNKFFRLFNNLNRSGKIWINNENITEYKNKNPTVGTDIPSTLNQWENFFKSKFEDREPENIHIDNQYNGFDTREAERVEINEGIVALMLSKCKMNTAAGHSGIGQRLIKSCFEANPTFMTQLLSDVLNFDVDPSMFFKLNVVPIYKGKRKNQSLPSSYRPVSLGENIYKLAESIYIHMNKDIIEHSMGEHQQAYKRGGGTAKCLARLHSLMQKHKKGQIISIDLAGAFDSPHQRKMICEMFKNQPHTRFLHLYKKIIENLKMDIDLKFGKVKDIPQNSGCPQGLKMSCFIFCMILHKVLSQVGLTQEEIDQICYSDDVTFICSDYKQFCRIFIRLQIELKVFGLKIETSKTSIIRFGEGSIDLPDELPNPESYSLHTDSIKVKEYLRFLGYFIRDTGVIDLNFHLNLRIKESNLQMEEKFLKQIHASMRLNLKAKRVYFINRQLAKLFQGTSTIVDILHGFRENYTQVVDDVRKLKGEWAQLRIPELNYQYSKQIIPKLKDLVMGLKLDQLIPVVFKIKPPHLLGVYMEPDDQLKQWAGNKTGPAVNYIKDNTVLIKQLYSRKFNLKSEKNIVAILSGHYQVWCLGLSFGQKCDTCKKNYNFKNLTSPSECCGLKINGSIPKGVSKSSNNVKALKFIDKLKHQPQFFISKQNNWFKKEPNNCYDIKADITMTKNYDHTQLTSSDDRLSLSQLVAYTDGSCYKDKMSTGGICFVNGHLQNLENEGFMSPLPHSNQRAELQAILRCLIRTNTPELKHVKLTIRTDSKQSIDCVLKWFERFRLLGFKKSDGVVQKNIDLIQAIKEQMQDREVQLSWVKGHSFAKQNEIADDIAGKELIKLKTVFGI